MQGECGGPPALPGLVLLLMNLHRDHHLKRTGKILCPFTGSRFNIPLTASVMDMDRVTSAALRLLKPEEVELSTDTAEGKGKKKRGKKKKKQSQVKGFYRLQQAPVLAEPEGVTLHQSQHKTLLSTPAKESTKAAPRTALPALQSSWRTEAACMALSGWKALLKIGGVCSAGRSCRCLELG